MTQKEITDRIYEIIREASKQKLGENLADLAVVQSEGERNEIVDRIISDKYFTLNQLMDLVRDMMRSPTYFQDK